MPPALTHHTTRAFRTRLEALPSPVRRLARKNFNLLRADLRHPSLRFKLIRSSSRGNLYSARVGRTYRVLGQERGDHMYWQWIGPHDEYDKMLAAL